MQDNSVYITYQTLNHSFDYLSTLIFKPGSMVLYFQKNVNFQGTYSCILNL